MYLLDSGAPLEMMEASSLSLQDRKPHERPNTSMDIHTVNGIAVPQKEAKICIQEVSTHSYVKWKEDPPCFFDDCAMLSVIRRKPDTSERQENHHVVCRQNRSSRRGYSAEGCSIYQARPRQEKPCTRYRSGGNRAQITGRFSLKV